MLWVFWNCFGNKWADTTFWYLITIYHSLPMIYAIKLAMSNYKFRCAKINTMHTLFGLKILFLFRPDEFMLILVCTKWTLSFGCFEIVSAINGLIRLFDTSSPFITPGKLAMSNYKFHCAKKIQRTCFDQMSLSSS